MGEALARLTPGPVDVERLLSGAEGHRAVRALLVGSGRTKVEAMLRTMTAPRRELRSCRLRSSHFKPGRKLTGIYDARVDGCEDAIPIAVAWSLNGDAPAPEQLDAAEADLWAAFVPTAFERLWAIDDAWRMSVLASPLDPTFPALVRLSDPAVIPELVGRSHDFTVHPVRYRPGERHVLEYRSPRRPGVFAKLYRHGDANTIASATTALADLLSCTPGVRAVRPATVLDAQDTILYDEVIGMPLSSMLGASHPTPRRELRQVGEVLRAIHALESPRGSSFKPRRLDEIRAIHRACKAIAALRPDLGARAATVVERARERLDALEAGPPSLVHGELNADHVLLGPCGITLLDTDRCALADPALDLGTLIADLRWWSWVGSGAQTAPGEADLLAGYGYASTRVERARLYAAMLLVKMAARRIPVASRDWGPRTARLLAVAERGLES